MTNKISFNYRGFNLIELMVTVGIMTVIAGIAFPIYTGYVDTTRFSEANTQIAAVNLAQSEFFLENNVYFATTTGGTPSADSDGLYTTVSADLDYFEIAITGACGTLATCYRITATGKNEMAGETITVDGP